uniref:GnRH1 n=1 Tax=Scyliorhinus canicula TaxID=7830 RepID=A0A386IQC7_SCYCA|nr:GnRH1 precursor [Scyliorhinus canicula]
MKLLVCFALGSAIFVNFLSAQHWSFDLRPGGKREADDDLVESFQEDAGNVDGLTHNSRMGCPFPDCLRGTLAKFTPRRRKL